MASRVLDACGNASGYEWESTPASRRPLTSANHATASARPAARTAAPIRAARGRAAIGVLTEVDEDLQPVNPRPVESGPGLRQKRARPPALWQLPTSRSHPHLRDHRGRLVKAFGVTDRVHEALDATAAQRLDLVVVDVEVAQVRRRLRDGVCGRAIAETCRRNRIRLRFARRSLSPATEAITVTTSATSHSGRQLPRILSNQAGQLSGSGRRNDGRSRPRW